MTWYKKYLLAYEKAYSEVPQKIVEQIRNNFVRSQNDQPLVSVVIIAYNEGKHLLACLWSLSENRCKYPVEFIGVNNNSTDNTEQIYQQLHLPYYNEKRQGPGFARNCGLEQAKGKYYICIDADTIYPPHYIETMVKALEKPKVVGVFSLWSYIPDKQHSWTAIRLYEFLRDTYLSLQSFKRPELCVRGMVFAHSIEYGKKAGCYRTDIKRGEDGSLALSLKQYGKLRFIHSRKARPVTGYGTVSKDGSFFNSFKVRAIKALKNIGSLFIKKTEYKDEESNLIK